MKCVKFCASLGLALACLPVYAQDAQPKVSFKCAASPLSKVIPALAKATGLSLSAEGTIARSVVQISVKDVDPQTLMQKIADVSCGRWEKRDDFYMLVLNNDQNRDDLRDEQAARAEAIKKAIDKALSSSSGGTGGVTTSVRTMSVEMGGQGRPAVAMGNPNASSNKAIYQMLQLIGPTTLAQIQSGSRVVFAYPANRAQRALPNSAAKIVNTVIAEMPQRPGPPQVAAKVHLVVSRQLLGGMLMVDLKVGDPGGRTIIRDMTGIPVETEAKPVSLNLKNGGTKIELTETAADLAKLFASQQAMRAGAGGSTTIVSAVVVSGGPGSGPGPITANIGGEGDSAPPTEKAKIVLLSPDKFEPLSYVPGEALQAIASAEELNLVACIPDSALVPAATTLDSGTMTVKGLVSALSQWRLLGQLSDGFLCLKPSQPATAITNRLDRGAIAAALKASVSQGYLTLDQKANYVNAQPIVGSDESFETKFLSAISPSFGGAMQSGLFSGERKMLKLYAQLTMLQRQALFAGKSIVIGSLMPAARNLVYDMAFNSSTGLNIQGPGGPNPRMAQMNDMGTDPTELLSNGVPDQATITVRSQTNDTVYGITKSGSRVAVSPSSFSMVFTGDPSTGLSPSVINSANQYSKYQLGKQTQLQFTFQLTPIVSFTRTLADDRFDINSKQMTFDELPSWFRTQSDEAQKNIQRMQDRMQQGQGMGQGQRPPNP